MIYDVIVAGYGPVGATAAALLARLGLNVAVVEQSATIYDKPRAISLDHEVMRVFPGLRRGARPRLVYHAAHRHRLPRRRRPDHQTLRPDAAAIPARLVPSIVFVQPKLEAALRACVARNGAEVFLETRLVTFEQDGEGVAVTARHGNEERILRARYLLACDGANSFVRRTLGIGVDDLAFDEWWMVVDTRQKKPTKLPAKSTQYCEPERPSTFVMGPEDLRRWEIKLLPGDDPETFGKHDNVARLLARHVDLDAIEIWRTAVYRFHALTAQRWRDRRVFLLGDACHQMPPFLGQGLCAGVRDVGNLAWKLNLVIKSGARDGLLDSYEEERKPHVRTIVEHAKDFGETVGELDPARARARDIALREQLARGEAETVRQRFIPGLTSGVLEASRDGGTLFVQPRVQTAGGEIKLLDDVLPYGFLLATQDAGTLGWLDAEALAMWQKFSGARVVISQSGETSGALPAGVLSVVEQDGLFAQWMQQHGAAAVLVRPDRYAYAVARNADELNSEVQRLAGLLFA